MIRSLIVRTLQLDVAIFLANFGFGKGLAFLGPIWLGLALAPESYATLEYALASAGILVLFANAGVPQSAMQLVVVRRGQKVDDLLAGMTAGLGAVAATAALALAGTHRETSILCAVLVLTAFQQNASAYSRAHGWRNITAWADHIHMVSVVTVVTLLSLAFRPVTLTGLQMGLIALAVAVTALAFAAFARLRGPHLFVRFREASALGLPILAASLCMNWALSSARIYLDWLMTKPDLYAYSYSFRVGGLLILLHAIVTTAFSARLYGMRTRQFDRVASWMILALGAGALAFIWLVPQLRLAAWVAPGNAALLAQRPEIAFVAAQIFFWGATGFIEMRLSRVRRAGSMVPRSLAVVTVSAAAIYVLRLAGSLTFAALLWVLVLQQAMLCLAVHEVLARRKAPLRRAGWATIIAGSAVTLAAALVAAQSP